MKHFLRIAQGVDTMPVLNALAVNPDLWDENTLRTTHPGTAHAQVSDIWIFFNAIPADPTTVIDDKDVIPYRGWDALPQLRPIVFDLMRRVEGTRLGRVIISRMRPGAIITPHVDGGAPATYYSRYQIALQSEAGCLFHAGDETVNMRTGEAWWFDNQQTHSVVNNSADDRISVIVDIRT